MRNFVFIAILSLFAVSCVTSGTHKKVLDELAAGQKANAELKAENEKLAKECDDLKKMVKELTAKNDELKEMIKKLSQQLEKANKDITDLNKSFLDAMEFNGDLKKKIKSLGSSIVDLESKKTQLSADQQKLQQELEQLRKLKDIAEQRNAEFNNILLKFKKMIDSGALSVKIRNGRMIVTLSSDILFSSGSAKLTDDGKKAISELCNTLKEIRDRNFLIVGHSDATPMRTQRFPSNWELSSQRAIEVVKIMIESGVAPEILSAAGSAEFDPVAQNDTDANKAQNRRVEIVFMPKIDELPGFGPALEKK